MMSASTAAPSGILLLEFDPAIDNAEQGKTLQTGLSVVLQIGNTLWVANDETASLERLTLFANEGSNEYRHARDHKRFQLNDYLQLPAPSTEDPTEFQEVDIEGLAYENNYLWLVGSHSIKRKKPGSGKTAKQMQKQLAKLSVEANRYLLARIPVVERDGLPELSREATSKGKSNTAGRLQSVGETNELIAALRDDEHLAPYLATPGKENGFDIEGLAVSGAKVFLGLRGPVLRGWAVIIELELKEDKENPAILRLQQIGPGSRLYKKHFLQLGGLGIRDLCIQGTDLLILAGPTMDLDGPVAVFRWKEGTRSKNECVLEQSQIERLMDLPFGVDADHAEGFCIYSPSPKKQCLLIVHDAAAPSRQWKEHALMSDIFDL